MNTYRKTPEHNSNINENEIVLHEHHWKQHKIWPTIEEIGAEWGDARDVKCETNNIFYWYCCCKCFKLLNRLLNDVPNIFPLSTLYHFFRLGIPDMPNAECRYFRMLNGKCERTQISLCLFHFCCCFCRVNILYSCQSKWNLLLVRCSTYNFSKKCEYFHLVPHV